MHAFHVVLMHVSCHLFAVLLAFDALQETRLVTGEVTFGQHHAKHRARHCYFSASVALCVSTPVHTTFHIPHWIQCRHSPL